MSWEWLGSKHPKQVTLAMLGSTEKYVGDFQVVISKVCAAQALFSMKSLLLVHCMVY